MQSQIQDGKGNGYLVEVDSRNKLVTASTTQTEEEYHLAKGDGFNVETPVITLTSNAKSGVLYIKNNDDEDLVITGFFNLLGAISGTTSGDMYLYYEFDTVGGTLISSTSNIITPVNKRAGSTNVLNATVLYGAEGKTTDTGLKKITSLSTGNGRNTLFVRVILPRGSSVSVSIKPFTGTTSMALIAALDCYYNK